LTDLKAAFEKKDYTAVLAGAPALLSEAQGLMSAVATKKETIMAALNGEWTSMASSLPQLLQAVTERVDVLGKSKKLPPNVNLESAKTSLTDATGLWDKAQSAFSSGSLEEAITVAKEVKIKAEAAATAVQLPIG
jgi:hypothetical protein